MKNIFIKGDCQGNSRLSVSALDIHDAEKINYVDITISELENSQRSETATLSTKTLISFIDAIPKIVEIALNGARFSFFAIPCECKKSQCDKSLVCSYIDQKHVYVFIKNTGKYIKFKISLLDLIQMKPIH